MVGGAGWKAPNKGLSDWGGAFLRGNGHSSDPSRDGRRPVNTLAEYEIRVSGLVPPEVLVVIEGVQVVVEPVQTVLRAPVPDQAALHGIINRLQRVGLDLIDVRRLPGGFRVERDCQHPDGEMTAANGSGRASSSLPG